MRNIVYWIGVIPDDGWTAQRYKYGDFEWMQYSKKTWEYWCQKNGAEFIHYDTPSRSDLKGYKINWQRWLDIFDWVGGDYDSVMLVDASTMVRWDAPNYFEVTDQNSIGCLRADENWGWTYKSAVGYADMFPGVQFNHGDYFSSGFFMFRKRHEKIIKKLQEFFYMNRDEILKREDEIVKRGRDQPIVNYIVQQSEEPVTYWPINYGVSHLYRREILNGNWQMEQNPYPFFIKYFYTWIFSGFPDRGDTRTKLMSQTWKIVKENYN